MPIAKPKSKESKDNFIDRCMSDNKTKSEFPDSSQRLAVCNSQWKRMKKENFRKEIDQVKKEIQELKEKFNK